MSNSEQKSIADMEVGTAEMADVLGISTRRLQQLASEGWIEGRVSHGRWNVGKTIRTWLTHETLSTRSR